MSQDWNKEEIKRYLKDANMYEENMSEDLMREYYKAIKNSESSLIEEKDKSQNPLQEAEKSLNDSANELLEAINNSESVAPSNKKRNETFSKDDDDDDDDSLDAFKQDILHKAKSRLKEEEANNNNNNINIDDDQSDKGLEILDIKKTPIGFNDMPKSENIDKNMLKVISHELKFINIQNSKKFLKSDSDTRIKMLCNYHIAATKLKAHFASLSKNMAPLGKPITAIDHDLCVNPVISSLKEEELLSNEVSYISRSGRLTKRKVYNEVDESSQDSFSNAKKSKNDDDWMSKSSSKEKADKTTKINLKNNSADKNVSTATAKTSSKINIRSESPDSSQSDIFPTQETKVDIFDELKENTPVNSKPRTYQRRFASNEEIMSRSSLFKDTPKKGRTAAMMSAVKDVTEKNKLQEEKIEKFTNSLDLDSQTFEDESEKIIVDDDDFIHSVFQRKRVIPTLPGRRPIHGKKRGGGAGPDPLSISTKKPNLTTAIEEVNSSALVNGASRRTALPRRASSNMAETRGEPSSSTVSRGKKELTMTPCPLCSVSFPQKEIETHAATCGEDMFAQTPQPKLSRITCEICDQVVPLTTQYEVHVKECIVKKNLGNGFH